MSEITSNLECMGHDPMPTLIKLKTQYNTTDEKHVYFPGRWRTNH